MTTFNKATLKTFFANGDIPTGQNYSDFIDSYVNVVDTSEQAIVSNFNAPKIITSRVSAVTGSFGSIAINGTFSANAFNTGGNVGAATATISGVVSAASLNLTGDVSAGNVYCQAVKIQSIAIISAAGTAQTTGAVLTATINRLQGVVDGQTTGFAIPANMTGTIQYFVNETNVSANLWPPVGGVINNLAANAAYGIAAGTSHTIFHTRASAYGVV